MRFRDARIQNVDNVTLPGSLKTAEEVAEKIGGLVSVERIKQLTNSGHMPCWIIDNEKFLYTAKDVKEWITKNLISRQHGEKYPPVVEVATIPADETCVDLPTELEPCAQYLHHVPMAGCPGVYFLIDNKKVVYVGQSVHVPARVMQHRKDPRKQFSSVVYLPVPPNDLNAVESAFILLLNPKYNGKSGSPIAAKNVDMSVLDVYM